MNASLFFSICFSGVFVLACCILNLLGHTKRGQALFRLYD